MQGYKGDGLRFHSTTHPKASAHLAPPARNAWQTLLMIISYIRSCGLMLSFMDRYVIGLPDCPVPNTGNLTHAAQSLEGSGIARCPNVNCEKNKRAKPATAQRWGSKCLAMDKYLGLASFEGIRFVKKSCYHQTNNKQASNPSL